MLTSNFSVVVSVNLKRIFASVVMYCALRVPDLHFPCDRSHMVKSWACWAKWANGILRKCVQITLSLTM